MVSTSLLISVLAGLLVLVIGGTFRRRNQRKHKARDWYADTIELISRITERADRELEGDELDTKNLIDDLDPLFLDLRIQSEDTRPYVEQDHIESIRNFHDFYHDQFREDMVVFQENGPQRYASNIIERDEEKLEGRDIDVNLSINQGLPTELVDPANLSNIENAIEGEDIDKWPELIELISGDYGEVIGDPLESISIADLLEFPFDDYSEFDDFSLLFNQGAAATVESYINTGLVQLPEKLKTDMRQTQRRL